MKKPLIRWTIGPAHPLGYECLEKSIQLWKKIFKNKFDIVVCHNQQNSHQLNILKKLEVDLICQENYACEIKIKPKDSFWKLYPPRLRLESHEIFIDNDLLIFKKFNLLEEFLVNEDLIICTEGHKRFYGNFLKLIKTNNNINTGFFGLPPFFDLKNELNKFIENQGNTEIKLHDDDQGILMSIFQNYNIKTINTNTISICNPLLNFAPYKIGTSGVHFTSLNIGAKDYWNFFNYIKFI